MSGRKGNDVFASGESAAGGWAGPTHNVMKDEFGLDIPIESVPIPSMGVVYPSGHPLHNCETIDIKPMTAREEDILTSKALIKKGTVITELLRSCIIDKRINPDDMIIGDRNAVMVALRITGYGSDYRVEVGCPACGEKSKQDFDLAELPIKRLDDQPVAEGSNCFEVPMPKNKETDPDLKIRYRFLTGKDEQTISVLNERKKKQGLGSDNLITQRYQHQILSVNDISDKTKIQMFIQKMPTRYSRALRNAMDNNEPGVQMKSHMNCPHCFEESEVSLPLGASFFWPDAE